MSEKQEKKRRYNLRLAYIAAFEEWLTQEPSRMFLWRWHRWKKRRPILKKHKVIWKEM
jgi:hypothetical protein